MRRTELYDFDWRFHLGDVPGAQKPSFNDSAWRKLDLPHDWSIEDLPARKEKESKAHVLDLTKGDWRSMVGDNRNWTSPDLNESGWNEEPLSRHCHPSIGPLGPKSYGWWRRKVEIAKTLKGKPIAILLGKADDVDETFFNGVKIGGHGKFPPKFVSAYQKRRLYRVPARLIRWGEENSVAVRVYSHRSHGGLFPESEQGRSGPFHSEALGGPGVAYATGGTAWYRKSFFVPASFRGQRFHLDFGGVYMNSRIWLNGKLLGEHPYGYTSFFFDITKHLKLGGENVLAVQVRNEGRNARWYSGSGIYRHVRLSALNPVHIAHWGTYVTTPRISGKSARVRVATTLENHSGRALKAALVLRIVDDRDREAARGWRKVSLGRGAKVVASEIGVTRPKLWSLEHPNLYRLVTQVIVDGAKVDETVTEFGIRSISFDSRHGFRLNGKSVLLKGGCVHHDNGPLGSCAYDRADERRVQNMKKYGYNAIRTSHNPPSESFLAACDRVGVLIIDEAFDQWNKGSDPSQYHTYFEKWCRRDLDSMVLRDRNHPCVIMWSIGNEIGEQATDLGLKTAHLLGRHIRKLDPTRPITQAINGGKGDWRKLDRLFGFLDVGGYNYAPEHYLNDHKLFPKRVMYASESTADRAHEYWQAVKKYPWVIGDFVWTGHDYLGEAGIGSSPDWVYIYPWTLAYCGDVDLLGFQTPASNYRDALWNPGNQLALFVHVPKGRFNLPLDGTWSWPEVLDSWNWPGYEKEKLRVVAYTSCDEVRLSLNGRALPAKKVGPENKLIAEWDVPYVPGTLKAAGYRKGRKVVERALRTAGKPKRILLAPDRIAIRADGQDLCYVNVEIVDAAGLRHPHAENQVKFKVEGAGTLAAAGSAKPDSTESFQNGKRRAWEGRCQAIIRAKREPGPIRLTATSPGLASAAVELRAE